MPRLSDPSQALVFDRIVASLTPRNSDRIKGTVRVIRDDADHVSDDHSNDVHVHLHHQHNPSFCRAVLLWMRGLMMHAL